MNDDKLWKIFSQYIRLKNSDDNGYCACFTCDSVFYFKDGDTGHGLSRKHFGVKYDERNTKPQCENCNRYHDGKQDIFKQRVDELHGKGTWDLLEMLSRRVWKISSFDVDVQEDYYKKEVDKLKASKHLK